jgi:hypothetical protein
VTLFVGVVGRGFGYGCAGTRQLGACRICHYLNATVSGRTGACLR